MNCSRCDKPILARVFRDEFCEACFGHFAVSAAREKIEVSRAIARWKHNRDPEVIARFERVAKELADQIRPIVNELGYHMGLPPVLPPEDER